MEQENDKKLDEQVTKPKEENNSYSIASFKKIVITEMTRIVKVYREKMLESGDTALIDGMNKKTDVNNVVNHIMNNLIAKRILGGSDESVYEFIHEYYVDKFDVVEDNWSSSIRPMTFAPANKKSVKVEANGKVAVPTTTSKPKKEAKKQEAIKPTSIAEKPQEKAENTPKIEIKKKENSNKGYVQITLDDLFNI